MTSTTRPAAVAGQFYPGDAASLRAAVREALAGAVGCRPENAAPITWG